VAWGNLADHPIPEQSTGVLVEAGQVECPEVTAQRQDIDPSVRGKQSGVEFHQPHLGGTLLGPMPDVP
jgi:hypothetical protein